jgi:hypothetical protein
LSSTPREAVNGIAYVGLMDLPEQQTSNVSTGHFLHIPTGTAYNGAKPVVEEMQNPSSSKQKLPTLNRQSWYMYPILSNV